MVALFHDMMHKEIEVYVDDMTAKFKTEEERLINLRKLFERLRKYQLRLNPSKCTFGVKSGKLHGFIVSQKGIEVDSDKEKAILEMPEPRTEKQVRGFLGRLNYITRFISLLIATCEPLFKLLRKNQSVQWNDDCQVAFRRIKRCLMNPPVLVPPVPVRPCRNLPFSRGTTRDSKGPTMLNGMPQNSSMVGIVVDLRMAFVDGWVVGNEKS
ncbi:uncharacterized mitochondrial protein AtMg00860-like [Glycine max]|uniref:uncharacterized mitochondrial protein AtMg00860-like n=1 Tax=Glycine max TaxID=3847 RepID=UPI000E21B6DE|nr:uncharacterized mitochondrial protein AtMg00860-like [Glycine max]|eukprot:XP_025979993.1 uncharacterized protein LOC112998164 [Glycine max]